MAPQNPLTTHGNDKTMNLNHLILTNIQSSPYFKVNLYELKTYHEVIDEIYFKVSHMEPWEKGSRKTAGQTGMCGGVRGVGAGGIVSSAFCLLYKLFTLKLTKKQVIGLITHVDSPYIRGLGFMFIRYTQPPGDLWDWYVDYLEDEEEIDVKAGGGHTITMGEMLRQFLTKLEWYSTLFPRIPVPIQKDIQRKMQQWEAEHGGPVNTAPAVQEEPVPEEEPAEAGGFGEAERMSHMRTSPKRGRDGGRASPPFDITKEIDREKDRQKDSKDRDRHRHRDSRDKDRHRDSDSKHKDRDTRDKNGSSRGGEDRHRDSDKHRHRDRDHRRRSRSRDRRRSRSPKDRKERSHRSRSRDRRRSRSRDRKERVSPPRRPDYHKKSHRDRREREHSYERDYQKKADRYEREDSYERDLRREKARQKSEKNGY